MIPPAEPPAPTREIVELLRQMISLQQEQLGLLKVQVSSQEGGNRWRSFLTRWEGEFPNIGAACKQALPVLERAYLGMIRDLTERVNTSDPADWDDEFLLGEFLDRFGIRLGQLANILSQLAPLADAAPSEEKG